MNINECSVILSKMSDLWPNFKVNDVVRTAESWAEVTSWASFKDCAKALTVYAQRPHEFAPSPGQLLEIVRDMNGRGYPDIVRAEALARDALQRTYIGQNQPLGEDWYKLLPKPVQDAIGGRTGFRRAKEKGFDEIAFRQKYKEVISKIDLESDIAASEGRPVLTGNKEEYLLPDKASEPEVKQDTIKVNELTTDDISAMWEARKKKRHENQMALQ